MKRKNNSAIYDLDFGQWLKGKRLSLGLTQQEVADKSGYISGQAIANMECGRSTVRVARMKRLAKALNVDFAELVERKARAQKARFLSRFE